MIVKPFMHHGSPGRAAMRNADFSNLGPGGDGFRESISQLLGVPLTSVLEVSHWTRLYSSGWTVSVDDCHRRQTYFVKRFGSPESAQRQAQLMQRADTLFSGDSSYVPLDVRHLPDSSIVLTRDAQLPCLYDTLLFGARRNPFYWYPFARRAIDLAGHWLRRFHASHAKLRSPVPALGRYAANRRDILAALPNTMYDDLIKAIDRCPEGPLTITHSDFNGWNILTDGTRLSVIDHGISEWVEMSPAWDVASFLVSFHAFATGNLRTPLHWAPPLCAHLSRLFLSAYGDPSISRSYTFSVCAALRHASSYVILNEQDGSRAAWHLLRLRWWLAETRRRIGGV